jgi:ABC-type transport system involved in multi-copper enzyme maturation permease subunit
MIRLVRTELLKLRTTRVSYGLLLTAVAITVMFASLQASGAGRKVAPIGTAAGQASVTTVTGIAMILAAVLGVIVTSGEFRHASATLTYLASPSRGRVLAAKAMAAAAAGALFGVLAGIVSTVTGLVWVLSKGGHLHLGASLIAGHIAGAGAGAALLATLGVAVGSLIRSQLAAVISVFVWALVLESILGGTVSAVRRYLPYTAASTLGGTKLGAAAFGPGYSVSTQSALPFIAAAALLGGIVVILSLVATRTTVRQDIS